MDFSTAVRKDNCTKAVPGAMYCCRIMHDQQKSDSKCQLLSIVGPKPVTVRRGGHKLPCGVKDRGIALPARSMDAARNSTGLPTHLVFNGGDKDSLYVASPTSS